MLHNFDEKKYREFIQSMMNEEMANYIRGFRMDMKCTIPAVATAFSKVYLGMHVNPDSHSDGSILCDEARIQLKIPIKQWNKDSDVGL